MIERYVSKMNDVQKIAQEKVAWRGLTNGIVAAVPNLMVAFAIYYSSYLIATKEVHFKNVMKLVKTL